MGQTKNYLQDLYSQSLNEVRNDFGTKGAAVILILKLSLTTIAIGSLIGLSFIQNNEPVYNIVLSIFASDILGLIALWVATPFAAIYRMPKVAAYKHYEQKSKIIRLEKRTRSNIVKAEKITITPREEFPHRKGKEYYYAYLEVYNGEDNDLLDCYANLTSLKFRYSDMDEWGEYIDWAKENTNELTWPNFDSAKDEKRIRRKNMERINIAKWKDGEYPIFIFADGTEESMPAENIYIEVKLNGETQKNSKTIVIEEILFSGFLKIHRGSYIQEGATTTTIRNGERYTEVEPSEELPYFRFYIKPGKLEDK